MTRDELIAQVAVLVAEYREWNTPQDYEDEAEIMVHALESFWINP